MATVIRWSYEYDTGVLSDSVEVTEERLDAFTAMSDSEKLTFLGVDTTAFPLTNNASAGLVWEYDDAEFCDCGCELCVTLVDDQVGHGMHEIKYCPRCDN